MFEFEACEVFKIKEFTFVNDCFKDEHNEEIGHSGQTLINLYFQSKGKKIEYVMLSGLKHPTKFSKSNTPQAMTEFIKEGHEIALTVFKNFNLITGIIKKHF